MKLENKLLLSVTLAAVSLSVWVLPNISINIGVIIKMILG